MSSGHRMNKSGSRGTNSFEWLELEILNDEIDDLREQLIEAKSRETVARVRVLEAEIIRSDERRTELLANLATNLINDASATDRRAHAGVLPGPTFDQRPAAEVADAEVSLPETAEYAASCSSKESAPQLATLQALTKELSISRVRLAAARLRKDQDLVRDIQKKIAVQEAQRKSALATAAREFAAIAQSGHDPGPIEHSTGQETGDNQPSSEFDNSLSEAASPLPQVTPNVDGAEVRDAEHNSTPAEQMHKDEVDAPPLPSFEAEDTSDAISAAPNPDVVEEIPQEQAEEPTQFCTPVVDTVSPATNRTEGGNVMWDLAELERTKKQLEVRRDEMLDRHAKELKQVLTNHAEELRQLDTDQREIEGLLRRSIRFCANSGRRRLRVPWQASTRSDPGGNASSGTYRRLCRSRCRIPRSERCPGWCGR